MIRVGFIINFDYKKWIAGFNLIINLIHCINRYSNNNIKPILFLRKSSDINEINFNGIQIIKTEFLDKNLLSRIFNKLLIILFGRSIYYDNFFKKHKIDLLSHNNVLAYNFFLGNKSNVKSLAWIPDFQYIHYPHNFSKKNNILRNINVKLSSKHSTRIILSSYDAQKDLKKVSDYAFKKSSVSSFFFESPKLKDIIDFKTISKKFLINKNFFYIPNQYWAQKNHMVVLKAILLLKNKFNTKDILIVSTGHSEDHRNQFYFSQVMDFVKSNSLSSNYIYLGMISYKEVLSLMFHSMALINPSKFEGRHSSVEQARSMGKTVILSDINIHREQNVPRCHYFNQDDFYNLSEILLDVKKNYNIKKEKKYVKIAFKDNNTNLENYYREFEKIVQKAINSH